MSQRRGTNATQIRGRSQSPTGRIPARLAHHMPHLWIPTLISCVVISSLVSLGQTGHTKTLDAPAADRLHEHRRIKRALYELPAGSELLLETSMRTTFTCDGLGYGFYADPNNDCKIFHVCQSFKMSDGSIYNNHWSFICPNQTVFNQVSLTCSHPEDAIPCEASEDFYHVNDYFGDVRAPSVKETDLSMASDLISRAYGSRLSSSSSSSSSGQSN